jgi:NAD(P)-dependent dehydrogenase (short-subunit alcohol dehydrogenase family)
MAPPQSVLVTGASSGIGRAVAEELHRRGFSVVAAARCLDSLDGLPCASKVELDVTNDTSVRHAVAAAGPIEVLINNAGIGSGGPAEHLPLEETVRQMDTNYFGCVRLTRAVLPQMRRRGSGTIVSLSSMSAKIPWPFGGSYAASKAAVDSYSEALRFEVAPFGIRVLIIEPGKIATNFGARFQIHGGEDDAYQPLSTAWGHQFTMPAPGPGLVADALANALGDPDAPSHITVGEDAAELLALRRRLPSREFDQRFAAYFGLQTSGADRSGADPYASWTDGGEKQ